MGTSASKITGNDKPAASRVVDPPSIPTKTTNKRGHRAIFHNKISDSSSSFDVAASKDGNEHEAMDNANQKTEANSVGDFESDTLLVKVSPTGGMSKPGELKLNGRGKNKNTHHHDDGDSECSPTFRFYIKVPSLMSQNSTSIITEGTSEQPAFRDPPTNTTKSSVKIDGVGLGKYNENLAKEEEEAPLKMKSSEMETTNDKHSHMNDPPGGTTSTTTTQRRLPGAAKFAAFRTYIATVATCRTTLSHTAHRTTMTDR